MRPKKPTPNTVLVPPLNLAIRIPTEEARFRAFRGTCVVSTEGIVAGQLPLLFGLQKYIYIFGICIVAYCGYKHVTNYMIWRFYAILTYLNHRKSGVIVTMKHGDLKLSSKSLLSFKGENNGGSPGPFRHFWPVIVTWQQPCILQGSSLNFR